MLVNIHLFILHLQVVVSQLEEGLEELVMGP